MLGIERRRLVLVLTLVNAQVTILPCDDVQLADERVVGDRLGGVDVD